VKDTHTGWYLVRTKPRQETVARINLQQQGFHIYLPLSQQHKRRRNLYQIVTEPLFPSYLFIWLSLGVDDWSKIRSTRGCVSLVRFGALPAQVPDKLIEQLKHDESRQLKQPETRVPDFKIGDPIRVIDGVLADYEGIIEAKTSQERVTILLTIVDGHTRSVSLSAHQVKMAN